MPKPAKRKTNSWSLTPINSSMTAIEFRRSPERVTAWRELLASNPLVAQVLVVLQDEHPPTSAPMGTDALDRAAMLASVEQHKSDYNLLLSLAEMLPVEAPEEEMTWGQTPKTAHA